MPTGETLSLCAGPPTVPDPPTIQVLPAPHWLEPGADCLNAVGCEFGCRCHSALVLCEEALP
jgi:hypothetical protein